MKVIGFMGVSRSGKTTAAELWQKEHPGAEVMSFARMFKQGVRAMFEDCGVTDPELMGRMMEGDLKDAPFPGLFGSTPRQVMITVAEAMRERIHPNVFVAAERNRMKHLAEQGVTHFVFSDVRKQAEAQMILDHGGKVYLIEGRGKHSGHFTDDLPRHLADRVIINDGTLEDLEAAVHDL